MEPQKRKYVTQVTDGRGAASYIGHNRHTRWKKGNTSWPGHRTARASCFTPSSACSLCCRRSTFRPEARTASSAHSKLAVLIFKRLPLATAGALLVDMRPIVTRAALALCPCGSPCPSAAPRRSGSFSLRHPAVPTPPERRQSRWNASHRSGLAE